MELIELEKGLAQVQQRMAKEYALDKQFRAMGIDPCKFKNANLGRLSQNKYLYFIGCGDAVKIGVSSDPNGRLEALATGAPGRLHLIAMIPKSGHLESKCHKKIAHLHIHGEWFQYTSEINSLIKELLK